MSRGIFWFYYIVCSTITFFELPTLKTSIRFTQFKKKSTLSHVTGFFSLQLKSIWKLYRSFGSFACISFHAKMVFGLEHNKWILCGVKTMFDDYVCWKSFFLLDIFKLQAIWSLVNNCVIENQVTAPFSYKCDVKVDIW